MNSREIQLCILGLDALVKVGGQSLSSAAELLGLAQKLQGELQKSEKKPEPEQGSKPTPKKKPEPKAK